MIIYVHGRDGTPWGTKVTALRQAGFEVQAPDLRGLTLSERVARVDEVARRSPGLLVGSSYGGLAVAWLAQSEALRFPRIVLLAPDLHSFDPPVGDPNLLRLPASSRAVIVHGTQDTTVPIEASRRYRARSGQQVQLVEVDDGHRLSASSEAIIAAVRTQLVT